MAVKRVYLDGEGVSISIRWCADTSTIDLGMVDDGLASVLAEIPLSELSAFRGFINDELDRIEKGIGDKEQAEAEREHKKFLDNI